MSKFPMVAYEDTAFMAKTTKELKEAKDALQKMLDCWNELGLPALHTTLFRLAHDPQGVHAEAVPVITGGKLQLSKDIFMRITEAPCPNQLYIAARLARNQIQTGRPELWSISSDGKKVVLDKDLAKALIESQNIIAVNEAQLKFTHEVAEYVRLSNSLNEQLKAIPWMRMPAPPWILTERSFPLIAGLELQADQLREIAKSL